MKRAGSYRIPDYDKGPRPWREGKVRPLQGNAPHDRPVSRGVCFVKERLRRSLFRHCLGTDSKNNTEASGMRFLRHGGIYHPDVAFKIKTKPWGGTVPPPAGRPRAQVKERAGRITPSSSSVMSSGRLFLDRVARQHGPSPLHRQPDHKTLDRLRPRNYHRTVSASFPPCLTGGVHPIGMSVYASVCVY